MWLLTARCLAQDVDDVMQHVPMASVLVLKGFGCDSKSEWPELLLTAGVSYAVAAGTTYCLKHTVNERRPDGTDCHSFPSGHATFAFAGATALRHEYGHLSPWVTIGGYGVATLVAADRVRRDRHYIHDVCAGAAIGVLATELTYFVKRKFFKDKRVELSFTGQSLSLAYNW